MTKKRVFITGATGNMGGAALKELLGRRDRFDIVLLARPGKKNIKKLKYLKDEPGVDIIWGDLTDYDSVLNGVTGADYVLHIGGMVSPAADMYPERTLKVNVQGARNVVLRGSGRQPSASKTLGTDRRPDIHQHIRLVLSVKMPCRTDIH